jgi:hypothetical protein
MMGTIVDKKCLTELIQSATVTVQDIVMANSVKEEDVLFNAINSAYDNNLLDYHTMEFYQNNHTEALKDKGVLNFYTVFMRQVQWSKEVFLSALN